MLNMRVFIKIYNHRRFWETRAFSKRSLLRGDNKYSKNPLGARQARIKLEIKIEIKLKFLI